MLFRFKKQFPSVRKFGNCHFFSDVGFVDRGTSLEEKCSDDQRNYREYHREELSLRNSVSSLGPSFRWIFEICAFA